MSRIIVKNLPKRMTEEELKSHFEAKGVITDLQLKYTKSGEFRQFAFIGYKSEVEAQAALSYYHNTFINTSKIKVEICTNLGDPSKPRAWSKYASDSSANIMKNKHEKKSKSKNNLNSVVKTKDLLGKKMKDDPEFEEFIQLHKSEGKKLWANDTVVDENFEENDDEGKKNKASEGEFEDESCDENEGEKKLSDLDYLRSKIVKKNKGLKIDKINVENAEKLKEMNEFAVTIRGLPLKCKKSLIKEFFKPLKIRDIRQPRSIGITYVQFSNAEDVKSALIKHRGFLDGKRVHIRQCKEQVTVEDEKASKWEKLNKDLSEGSETIIESGCLFIRNLAYTVTEDELQKLFGEFGPIAEIRLPIDRYTRRIMAFAFIEFVMPEHAFQAFSKLDGVIFQGRVLHILPGKSKPDEKENEEEKEGESYKKSKVDKLKKESGNSFNWNTLFLGANAVADVISQKYNTTKQNLLSHETSESIAVRMALGETQIVIDTKKFLESNGINLEAFEKGTKNERSKTIILVKNLPADTSCDELKNLFNKFGEVGRVILPPSGITAVIEFHDPYEAKKAFKKLAYTKFYDVPLYLEWAPGAVFVKEFETFNSATPASSKASEDEKSEKVITEGEEKPPESGATLYVKNLNFDTIDDSLKSHFQKYGQIHSATVAKKPDVKHPGNFLSMGYGFVQFINKSDAQKAIKLSQHSVLDGHKLELKLSDRATKKDIKSVKSKSAKMTEQNSPKILVRNIPFEANKIEVTNLFKTFGELKAVRLPQKMTGTEKHRGFAFIEYSTKPEAKRAFEALRHSTHLYGRRLVLEWADAESESVEKLRTKTAQHYHEDAPAPKKIRKAAILNQLMAVSDT